MPMRSWSSARRALSSSGRRMTLRTSAIAIFRRSFSAALMRVVCGIPEKNSTCAHKPRRAALSPALCCSACVPPRTRAPVNFAFQNAEKVVIRAQRVLREGRSAARAPQAAELEGSGGDGDAGALKVTFAFPPALWATVPRPPALTPRAPAARCLGAQSVGAMRLESCPEHAARKLS